MVRTKAKLRQKPGEPTTPTQLNERRGEPAPLCLGGPLPIYPLWLQLIKHLSRWPPRQISHPHFVTLMVGCSPFPTRYHSRKLLGVYSSGAWQGWCRVPINPPQLPLVPVLFVMLPDVSLDVPPLPAKKNKPIKRRLFGLHFWFADYDALSKCTRLK